MPETPPQAQDNIKKARAELLAFKQENDLRGEKSRDPHWEYIDLDKLSEEEADLYLAYAEAKSIEDLTAVTERLNARRQEVRKAADKERENNPDFNSYASHPVYFIAWLANKINGKMGEFYRNEDFDRR
jgi:hypothetical protein